MAQRRIPSDLDATVSATAIRKSGRVLKAVSHLYLPFYGLKPVDIFDYFGPIAFSSAFIYQVDELNEQEIPTTKPSLVGLRRYLLRNKLLHSAVDKYLRNGELYLKSERKYALRRNATLHDILAMMKLRSSDFRILHCILRQSLGLSYEARIFKIFAKLEMLMEIDDDILSYQSDVKQGCFNLLGAIIASNARQPFAVVDRIRAEAVRDLSTPHTLLDTNERLRFRAIVATYKKLVPSRQVLTTLMEHKKKRV